MDEDDALRWRTFGERTVYDNPWVRLVLVDVQPPEGERFEHHVVRLQTVALAVVLDADERVLMLWRHRFATQEWGWELPGGIVDAGEDGAEAASREVLEETGWRPGAMTRLLAYQPMPGMVDTPHEIYVARGAERVSEPTDREEAARVDWVPLSSVPDLIRRGQVLGSGSLVGLLALLSGVTPGRDDDEGSGGSQVKGLDTAALANGAAQPR